ncbi:HpcH/HpaI aldolase/citrate lyase family protein [Kitasatospora sp. NPDC089509]|uniref:HpcH/HpaI aldolase/citrate lyase family protein n=1 Tax=Kitasatospora sp. NPDC089509 TaxID=3364079 RepID=UPI00382937F5
MPAPTPDPLLDPPLGPRSWLYVPGDRPERYPKALAAGADAVVIDLEDAVAPARKEYARRSAAAFLREQRPHGVHVRINPLADGGREDLAALAGLAGEGLAGLRLPKVESARQVRAVAGAAPGVGLWPTVESALGLEHAYRIATAHPRVRGLLYGTGDLAADLATTDPDVLAACAVRVLVAARAAGLPRPPLSVHPDLHDPAGLAADTRRGRERGFHGRSVIHPAHVPVVHAVFAPTAAELAAARAVVADAEARGTGARTGPDGRFTDAAVVRRARAVLAAAAEDRADRIGHAEPPTR